MQSLKCISSISWRTRFLFPRTYARKSSISLSLTPSRTTIFNLIGVRPASSAASIPTRTSRNRSIPKIFLYVSGFRLSRLTLTRLRPAFFNSVARSARRMPFVVIEDSIPAGTDRTISKRSDLSKGSPPVNLTLRISNFAATRRISAISPEEICSFGDFSPSLWQYMQERLHFGVRLIRRLLTGRLKGSLRITMVQPTKFFATI